MNFARDFKLSVFVLHFKSWNVRTQLRASSANCILNSTKVSTKKYPVLLNKETKLRIFLFVKAKHKAHFSLFRSTQYVSKLQWTLH